MARTIPPAYRGVDFNTYQGWSTYRDPIDSKTYYLVPGVPGAMYDPTTGVVGANIAPSKKVEAEKTAQGVLNPKPGTAEEVTSAIIPVVGGVAGTAGGIYVGKQLLGDSTKAVTEELAKNTPKGGIVTGGTDAAAGATANTGTAAAGAAPISPTVNAGTAGAGVVGGEAAGAVGGGGAVPATPTGVEARYVPAGSGILENPNFGNVAQGVGGAIQTVQGVGQLQKGNYVGGGINTAAGVGNLATAFAPEATTAMLGSQVVPGLNVAAGLYGGYETAKYISDAPSGGRRNAQGAMGGAASGAAIGTAILPGVGTAVGAGIGALTGLASSVFGSSKGERQQIRDKARKGLQEAGILDSEYMGTLADGSKFDFGKDGGKHSFEKYKDDPNFDKAGALANVLAAAEGLHGKAREAVAALYARAALSNAGGDYNKMVANIRHFAEQRGMNPKNVQEQLDAMRSNKKLDDNTYSVFSADSNEIFNPAPPAQRGKQPPTAAVTAPKQQVTPNTKSTTTEILKGGDIYKHKRIPSQSVR